MDGAFMSRVLKRLFSHETCSRLRYQSSLGRACPLSAPARGLRTSTRYASPQIGGIASSAGTSNREAEVWNARQSWIPPEKIKEAETYPMVTSDGLRGRKNRPRRVKMLLRDFIEGMAGQSGLCWLQDMLTLDADSLYNPQYGYFSKHAVIFSPGQPFEFNKIKNESHFLRELSQRYKEFEDALDYKEPNETRQLWHTPTELFRPYYSEAITRYLVDNYMLSHHPYHDLVVYEMGAGNGTMMLSMLDHIRDLYPDVYERTKFNIIEISSALADMQLSQLMRNASARGHRNRVEIVNRSIFEWNTYVPEPCYFLALEVFDNFSHDAISYDLATAEARQQAVLIDAHGEIYPYLTPSPDALASRFLRVRDVACDRTFQHPLRLSLKQRLRQTLPFAPTMSDPEYIPTRLMQFFDILHRYFPLHRLVASDFHYLTDTVVGVNAPVVQTRFQRQTIPVTTPLVSLG